MYDEFNQPNKILRGVLGVEEKELEEAKEVIRFEKQDLPFAKPLAGTSTPGTSKKFDMPVYGARSKVALTGAKVLNEFQDKLPSVTGNKTGKGQAYYLAYLPGLSYFKPAIPLRPVDRGATDDSMAHFIPRDFHMELLTRGDLSLGELPLPVSCSERLVENTVIQAKQGTVISLINWSGVRQKNLMVRVNVPVPTKQVSLASGAKVTFHRENGKLLFKLDLDVADALILR